MKTIPGTCIAPAALADRWLGGDSIAALAADFELSAEVVEAVIRQWADERTRPAVDMTPGMQPRAMRESAGCHAGTDGDCYWSECPQIMDGEPHKSGRSCPLCNSADDS